MKRKSQTDLNNPSKKLFQKKLYNKLFKISNPLKNNSDSSSDDEDNNLFNFDEAVTIKDNHIYYKTNVTDASVEKLIKIISDKNSKFEKLLTGDLVESASPKPLFLHITSYGGSLFAGFRAADAILASKIPIHTIVDGYAASAATIMSVVGARRFITPHSYMLIHQLSAGALGKYWEIKDRYKNCKMFMSDICAIYIKHTKLTQEILEKQLSHDSWWKPTECLKTGLVDEIKGDLVDNMDLDINITDSESEII